MISRCVCCPQGHVELALSIIGEHDPNLMITRQTEQYMANLELHVIEGANHMSTFSSPEFLARVQSFLAAHPAAREPQPTGR